MASKIDAHTLYQRCRSTDPAENHAGFQQLGELLLRVARAKLNPEYYDWSVAEECTQEALRNIWEKLAGGYKLDNSNAFVGWSTTVVQRKCIDRIRYESRRGAASLDNGMDERDIQGEIGNSDNEHELIPIHKVLLDERRIELLLSVQNHPKLSGNSKTILAQGFLFEKTDDELATLLGTKKSNVRVIRHRNLEKLRKDDDFMTALQQ